MAWPPGMHVLGAKGPQRGHPEPGPRLTVAMVAVEAEAAAVTVMASLGEKRGLARSQHPTVIGSGLPIHP